MLYAVLDIDKFPESDFATVVPFLSEQRLEKILRYRYFKDQRLSTFAYLLLRFALNSDFQISEAPKFSFGQYGKPFLRDRDDIFFSISHTQSGVVCGVSKAEIGVDIADRDPKNLDCTESAMHPNERAQIHLSKDPAKTFARFWALKESFLKCIGTGISSDIKQLDFSSYSTDEFSFAGNCMQIFEQDHAIIASCAKESRPLKILSNKELLQFFTKEPTHG